MRGPVRPDTVDNVTSAVASAPPMAVAGLSFFGISISDWVQVMALIWLVVQIGWFLYSKITRKDKAE